MPKPLFVQWILTLELTAHLIYLSIDLDLTLFVNVLTIFISIYLM